MAIEPKITILYKRRRGGGSTTLIMNYISSLINIYDTSICILTSQKQHYGLNRDLQSICGSNSRKVTLASYDMLSYKTTPNTRGRRFDITFVLDLHGYSEGLLYEIGYQIISKHIIVELEQVALFELYNEI